MAAKVIHFKKNGSSAPQKFVADDGGNNISAFLSSPRGAETIFLPFYRHRAARKQYFRVLSSPRGAGTILLSFYRHRAARKQYFCLFIVTVRRGNNIFVFYRRRAARKQYSCLFIVTARRGNNIFAFYRRRAARERYFCCFIVTVRRGNNISAVSVLAVLLRIHSRTVLTLAGQLRASRNVARTARGWRRDSCRGENEKQPFEIE